MKHFLLLVALCATLPLAAETYDYVWSTVFPNYEQQTPKSDFTLDNHFQIDTDKGTGVTGAQFLKDNKAGLTLRLYALNTLKLTTLQADQITRIEFVIGGNGCAALAKVTPSTGEMDSIYIGKDPSGSFREYRYFWSGKATTITFTVGAQCEYGYECLENQREAAGTFMTKQMIITTESTTAIEEIDDTSNTIPMAHKVLRHGQIYIYHHGQHFNTLGQRVE